MYHAGKDGWLFLTGGTNEVADQYRRIPAMDRVLRLWRRRIRQRIRRCEGLGTRYLHLVVPEKLSVYEDRFDGLTLDPRLAPAHRLGALMRWSWKGRRAWIDLLGPMRARRDGPDLHYRTDTHWNIRGCLLAYRLVCRACGQPITTTGARIDVSPKQLGYDVCCFIGIILKSAKDYPSALAKLESLEEVTEAYYTTGHYSIFIKVMCRSIDALQQVLINKIQTIDEIQSTETLISLQNPIMRTIRP